MPRHRIVRALRLAAATGVALLLCGRVLAEAASAKRDSNQQEADALFTNGVLHRLQIDIPKQGLRSLRLDPRQYVTATLREGPLLLTNVMVRLKGGAGSFRDLDDKPGLTVNLRLAKHGARKPLT